MLRIILCLCALPALPGGRSTVAADESVPSPVSRFVESHCVDCHGDFAPEADLDLTSLDTPAADSHSFETWVRVFDRVHDGEMPPPDAVEVDDAERARFVEATGRWLRGLQRSEQERFGRVQARRLTNRQLEKTFHDLLGIDIPLASRLPEDPRTEGFTTVADGQPMSHFQLEQHLTLVDAALDEAFGRAGTPEGTWEKTLSSRDLSRRRLKSRTREPEWIDDKAVVWSSGLNFYGRLPATTAREDGWYRFVVTASALKPPDHGGVWCTVRSGKCVSSAPLLGWVGSFEATETPQEMTFEAWLPKGHMLEIRPGDRTLKQARFQGGQVGTGEGGPQDVPGVAIHSIGMEKIHRAASDEEIRRILFGDLTLERRGKRLSPVSDAPQEDAARLLQSFAERAFRRPVDEEIVAPYIALAQAALEGGESLDEALRAGYRAILCSPRFLYFHEPPGPLDPYALASRLSYFLTGSMPDENLMRLAETGRLQDPQVLTEQVDRLLDGPRGRKFVEEFAHEWLELSEIDFTEPDRKLYREFDLIVQQSMLAETQSFLAAMLENNWGVSHLVDSDRTWLNSRLARYYGIDGVEGDQMRPVELPEESPRGGLLTQGAILKVTANGTTTSPVLRGVWVCERLLGIEVPPPPANVPAVEPDIRGATTIREMLAKHRSEDSCASCHVKIDPPGFALENFDPAGQWRDRYLRLQGGRAKPGAVIDASDTLPDGRAFESINEFKQLIASEPERLARNLAEKLLTYGTGAPISFADRPEVERIVARTAASDYGFRSLIKESIASELFRTK